MQSLTIKTLLLDTTFLEIHTPVLHIWHLVETYNVQRLTTQLAIEIMLTNVLIRLPCFPYFVLFDPFVIDPSIQLWPSSLDRRLRKIMLMLQLI